MSKFTAVSPEELERVEAALSLYDLPTGERQVLRNTIGSINKTFVITCGSEKRVLRESHPATSCEHLAFEAEVFRYFERKQYPLVARLLANKNGEFLTAINGTFYMLQTFLPGVVRASWYDLHDFNGAVLESFFEASARFTKAARDFKPSRQYANVPLSYCVQNAEKLFDDAVGRLPQCGGKDFLHQKRGALLNFAAHTADDFVMLDYDNQDKQLVHFDLHPGNMHFDGDAVVGIFDFDWTRMDSRFSDIGSNIMLSCNTYGSERPGRYYKEKIVQGLKAYKRAYGASDRSESEELSLINAGTRGQAFYQFLWAIDWYGENMHKNDAFYNLRHFCNCCLENDYDELFSGFSIRS